jgi:hypothetical protein
MPLFKVLAQLVKKTLSFARIKVTKIEWQSLAVSQAISRNPGCFKPDNRAFC